MGGKPPKKDDDDDKKSPKKLLSDENLLMKTFINIGAKIKGQIQDEDSVGVGNTKIVIPDFMKTYSNMFVDSKIMESILPRKLTNAQELRDFNPYLLDEEDEYEYADFEGINDVSTFRIFDDFLGVFGSCI
jgi:hypothetical protein